MICNRCTAVSHYINPWASGGISPHITPGTLPPGADRSPGSGSYSRALLQESIKTRA